MNFREISIEQLIPQRPPIVMVDTLLFCNRLHTQTGYTVAANGVFIEDNHLSAVGLIENIAQTVAARMGYLSIYGPEATGIVRTGVIGSIKNLVIESLPIIGSQLITYVDLIEEVGDMVLVKARVTNKEDKLATCEMIVSLI